MTKQFDLNLISNVTIVERNSSLPLKYKKEYQSSDVPVAQTAEFGESSDWVEPIPDPKIVVGLPMGKVADEWKLLVVKQVRIFTNMQPLEKKYPIMLEYTKSDTSVAYIAEFDEKTYAVVVKENEVLLEEIHNSMVPQEAVFRDVLSKLVLLHGNMEFLYWTVDNEFKLLDKNSTDMQVFSGDFLQGNEQGVVVDQKIALDKSFDKSSDNNIHVNRVVCTSKDPKCFPKRLNKTKPVVKSASTITQSEEDDLAFVFFLFLLSLLIFTGISLSTDVTMMMISGWLIMCFVLLANL